MKKEDRKDQDKKENKKEAHFLSTNLLYISHSNSTTGIYFYSYSYFSSYPIRRTNFLSHSSSTTGIGIYSYSHRQ